MQLGGGKGRTQCGSPIFPLNCENQSINVYIGYFATKPREGERFASNIGLLVLERGARGGIPHAITYIMQEQKQG